MTPLLLAAARSLLCGLLALGVWRAASHRSAAVRHWLLAAGIAASAFAVPLSFAVPQWRVLPRPLSTASTPSRDMAIAAPRTMSPVAVTDGITGSETRRSPAALILIVWMTGVVVALASLAVRLWRLARLTSRAEPVHDPAWRHETGVTMREYGITRKVDLRRTSAPDIVATWGGRAPVILIPGDAPSWDVSWIRSVVRHELAHVRRADWPLQMASDVVRALLWFNPVVWVLCALLRRESECACDDMVVQSGTSAPVYAGHLIDIARVCRPPRSLAAVSVAGPSTLERRISMLLNTNRDRRLLPAWPASLILAGMIAAGAALASVGVRAQATTGTLAGYVYDSSGAVLPGVEVVLEDERQVKWPTTTDATGRFEFTPVGSGKYTLRATLPGFRSLSDRFELHDARDWNRIVTMQVGELEETVSVTAKRPAAQAPSAATAAPAREPVRIGGNIKPPRKLVNVPPIYPASMREAGLEGVVPMEAVIAEDGSVASVRVLTAQVHPDFARAAEEAVRQWRFSQTLLNGVAVEVRMAVSVSFSLTD